MKCPVCPETTLAMTNREGIEIDYCPHCRGVWLDRGELDKIIERAAPSEAAAPPPRSDMRGRPEGRYENDDSRYRGEHGYHHKRKRKGLLGELFDFD